MAVDGVTRGAAGSVDTTIKCFDVCFEKVWFIIFGVNLIAQ